MEKIVTSCELRPKIWRWLCVVHKALNCTCYHRNHLWTSFGFVAGLYYQQTALENYSDSVNLVHCLVRLWCRYVQCVWSLYREDSQWCVVLVHWPLNSPGWLSQDLTASAQVGGTCKFFTYVAKIEKKTGEFQWRHYFWNCYCKEVIPNQLKIFATVKTKHYLFFRYDVNKNKGNGQNICEKVKFDKDFNWLGMTFLQYKSQK